MDCRKRKLRRRGRSFRSRPRACGHSLTKHITSSRNLVRGSELDLQKGRSGRGPCFGTPLAGHLGELDRDSVAFRGPVRTTAHPVASGDHRPKFRTSSRCTFCNNKMSTVSNAADLYPIAPLSFTSRSRDERSSRKEEAPSNGRPPPRTGHVYLG